MHVRVISEGCRWPVFTFKDDSVHSLPRVHAVHLHRHLEFGHEGSTYTQEIGQSHISGF